MEPQSGINLSEIVSAAGRANETGMEAPLTATAMVREAALGAGLPRAGKAIETLALVLGAPEAAKMAGTIVGEKARATQLSAADRLSKAATSFEEDLTTQFDLLGKGMTEVKDKSVAKAKDLGKRALTKGLSAMTWVEDRVVAVFEIPAGLTEKAAVGAEAKAAIEAGGLEKKAAEQAARELQLSADQQAKLDEILLAMAAEREKMSGKHEAAAVKVQDKIEKARGKAAELRTGAANQRTKVEGYRFFKGLLAKIKG